MLSVPTGVNVRAASGPYSVGPATHTTRFVAPERQSSSLKAPRFCSAFMSSVQSRARDKGRSSGDSSCYRKQAYWSFFQSCSSTCFQTEEGGAKPLLFTRSVCKRLN